MFDKLPFYLNGLVMQRGPYSGIRIMLVDYWSQKNNFMKYYAHAQYITDRGQDKRLTISPHIVNDHPPQNTLWVCDLS